LSDPPLSGETEIEEKKCFRSFGNILFRLHTVFCFGSLRQLLGT
jgi:hypothetical protein